MTTSKIRIKSTLTRQGSEGPSIENKTKLLKIVKKKTTINTCCTIFKGKILNQEQGQPILDIIRIVFVCDLIVKNITQT